ncbi:MAG: hypothetical protein KIS62_12930 [Ramlibacter sp.]|nr:hypothetical protein [Ramlibacter sp.]MCW5650643.1 hypothetical protein [Ramlibacter sp.]
MSDSVPSGSQWLSDTVSANTGLASMAIFKNLETYRKATLMRPASAALKETNKQLRLEALNAVVAEAIRLSQTSTSAAQLGVLYRYASLCLKRVKGIEAASGRINALRTVFAPSYAGNATARAAQRAGFMPKAKTLSGHDYWLEKLDPKHHSWRQAELMALFHQWEADAGSPLNLWDWLEANGSPAAVQLAERVIYLAPDRQWENACTIDDKGLVRKLAAAIGTPGAPLWSKLSNCGPLKPIVFYNPRFWAYVISPAGRLYVHMHVADNFHHSSLLAGGRVLGAGMVGVSNGRIVYINNKSGHYMPTPAEFFKAIRQLKRFEPHLDLSGALVEVIVGGTQSYLAWGGDWLDKKGDHLHFEGPLKTSDTRTDRVGAVRAECAKLIEAGQTWADAPAIRALIAKRVEIGFMDAEGRATSSHEVEGSPEWLRLRAAGWKTEAEQPDWFF